MVKEEGRLALIADWPCPKFEHISKREHRQRILKEMLLIWEANSDFLPEFTGAIAELRVNVENFQTKGSTW